MRKEDMRQAGQLMLTMNVFSYIQWVTNVPKSHSPDYPTGIRLECGNVGARRENTPAPECARTLDLI
ncbi:unnamed protein product [Pleuronectes platessa]|uniref:Uncharacterized protein n=1 Tax=Pleuronectes platessa TaxID=8262 RepID=A0A9N7V2Z7_PLEPL|nr:unnamed protein product [Pleuronectes platessa]